MEDTATTSMTRNIPLIPAVSISHPKHWVASSPFSRTKSCTRSTVTNCTKPDTAEITSVLGTVAAASGTKFWLRLLTTIDSLLSLLSQRHPPGTTGTILVIRLLLELHRLPAPDFPRTKTTALVLRSYCRTPSQKRTNGSKKQT